MPHPARSPRRTTLLEPLESRRLMAASDFGDAGTAIRYPQAAAAFPAVTGAGQTIAVIDSGIDYTHPALGGGFGPGFKVEGGYDFVDNDADPMDVLGHGTEVAGVLAASPTSGSDYQGIAPDAKLIALRIDDGDDTTTVPDALVEKALRWTIDHRVEYGITVVNISYGQGSYSDPTVSTVYGDEIAELTEAGVTIVAAAGNGGISSPAGGINSPAADPSVISVGSVNDDGVVTTSSQRSANLSIFAPGEDVLTTFEGGGYGFVGGTSYASPIVAGTVALMRNIDPTLKPADTMSILRASGVATLDSGTGTTTNRLYPRLDMLNALNLTNRRKPGSNADQIQIGKLGNQSAIAVDPQGVTHFVYYDVAARTMEYATRNTSGMWSTIQTIDTSNPFQGYYLSMAIDPNGQVAVAYFDGTNGDLKYARNSGSSWEVQPVDTKGSVGNYPSLVFDRQGLALITYYRKASGDLRAARRAYDGTFTVNAIDTTGDVGRSTSAAVNANGDVGVSYEDSTHGWVKYAQMDAATGTWANTVVDKTTRGAAYTSMAFSTADQSPWIAYYDAYPADLKVAQFKKRAWRPMTVATKGAVGLFNNLFFAGADEANVVYWDKKQNTLNRAVFDGSWSTDLLQSDGGKYVSGTIDTATATYRYAYYRDNDLTMDLITL